MLHSSFSLEILVGNHAKQGWSSGKSTHFPLVWPGIDSLTHRHTWIEFLGPLLGFERLFPWYSCFALSTKTQHLTGFDLL